MRTTIGAALCALLVACASGPTDTSTAPVQLSADASAGEAIFKASPENLKGTVNCVRFYSNVGRFANNQMDDVPGNLAYWHARLTQLEPDARRQSQLSAYVDAMMAKTFAPRPGRGALDRLQQGANYEYQVNQCVRKRHEFEGASPD